MESQSIDSASGHAVKIAEAQVAYGNIENRINMYEMGEIERINDSAKSLV